MATSTPNTVILEVNGESRPVYDGLKAAAGTIKPGMLIYRNAATTVAVVASADVVSTRMVSIEPGWAPDPAARAIDQTYASGDNVRYIHAQPGDLLYMRLAASQTVSIGSILAASGTAGELSVEATNVGFNVIGMAEEAVTTTGSAGWVKVRVL
jgi:hypothetical protein